MAHSSPRSAWAPSSRPQASGRLVALGGRPCDARAMAVFMDQLLARRLERTEGAIGVSFIPGRQRRSPEVGATWHEFAGTYAIFDGVDSPFTQTFGLGLFAPATADTLDAIEAFFATRGAAAMHEVSPLAGIDAVRALRS
jgi:hypothetical protein